MEHFDMDRLIAQHIAAETAGDPVASVAMYTDDIEHDVVGFPAGPAHGLRAAQGFYEYLVKNVVTEKMVPVHTYYGNDACIVEHAFTGTVPGTFLGLAGRGRRITFRMLHVWEFRAGRISRENVWLDGASIVAQLSAPGSEGTHATAGSEA